jgi:chromatin remodeling complex protein RSC6
MARRGGILTQKVYPDEALASIIGSGAKTRGGITKALWAYIKRNGLNEGRTIHLDETMQDSGIWGRSKKIDMLKIGQAFKHAS